MSRLDFAPKGSEIKITDVAKGLGEFTPRPEKTVAFDALAAALKKAGYTLAEGTATVQGLVEREQRGGLPATPQKESWYLRVPESKQRFDLRGFTGLKEGGGVTLRGRWSTVNGVETLTAGAN